ncbi:uncharacterized protein DUF3857 [Mucilaginibacter gracilis]|uniref:Uncharacterized protein DUF3857 n=1 Tax=Mucilaginibacter gracilis TaxID=423350 RepID=A0A495IYG1_9SPHI|nr:DUF3857 domain-containing protein [Mucilaginibacter gracilis]RKR81108.1 uncharacterized protein DUF3857 [Mucilaginibacter gracilis]
MKKVFTSVFCLFFVTHVLAQAPTPATMPFGKVDMADLQLKACEFEKDANAMVLFDKGDVYFDQDFNIVMERHKRIKIFNDKGKDEGNIRIEFYGGNRAENITDVQVETINENNGKPEITKLERKLIYTENVDQFRQAIVFAFPNVKAGSIIEYKYRFQDVASYSLPDWFFQGNIPCRYSEISTETPDLFVYKTQTHILQPFVKNISGSDSKTIGMGAQAFTYNTDKRTRGLANIPSLTDEPYMRSRADNLQRIYYQLTSIRPVGGFVRSFIDTWEKAGNSLIENDNFGGQLKRKLKDEELIISKAKAFKTDDEKIAFVFKQVKDRMKWNDADYRYTVDGTVKAWEKQTGNATEINLALCHLLKQTGVKVYPMVVSTRQNGQVSGAYPSLFQFNRAVVYIPVDSTKHYVLDASGKYNVYNETPYELLNSFGLYIDKEEKKYDLLFIDHDIAAREVVQIVASVLPDGKLDGTAEINSYSYHKLSNVEKYKKDGEEKYKKFLKNGDNNLEIASLKLENMDIDTLPLCQKIGFKLALPASDENYIYINPNLFSPLKTNPFLSENRATDIDFGCRNNYVITGSYKIPAGFKADALPKNVSMTMPDKSITFRRFIGEEDGMIKVSYIVNYKKTVYYNVEYPEFREFYKKMNDMLNEQIVLKKG